MVLENTCFTTDRLSRRQLRYLLTKGKASLLVEEEAEDDSVITSYSIHYTKLYDGVFRLLWNVIESGQECFAYVKNMAKNGDYYWVFANVTVDYDSAGKPRNNFV